VPPKLRPRARRALASLVVLAALAAAVTTALGAGRVPASQVHCGETITADTRLDKDLRNCPNNGIVIGADDITLDLNGHAVAGDGKLFKACTKGEFCDVGVLNDGHDGVTLINGSVREFGVGVFLGRARQNRVVSISSSKNRFFGFVIAESTDSVVRDSSASDNPAPEGDGLSLFGSDHIRILHNSILRNGLGIHVVDSADNLFRGNLFSRNSDFAILIEADRNEVRRNRCVGIGACFLVAPGDRNVIARNRTLGGGDGIAIEEGRGNLVARNVVVRASKAGIRLGVQPPPIGGAGTVVRLNLVKESTVDGFLVNPKDHRSLLIGNIASGSGDDGFDVRSRSTTLTANRAVGNADLGVKAVRGVIDGGGNTARGNRNPAQCVNVDCG
jgi:parallel beta-helix repeat protein